MTQDSDERRIYAVNMMMNYVLCCVTSAIPTWVCLIINYTNIDGFDLNVEAEPNIKRISGFIIIVMKNKQWTNYSYVII